MADDEADTTALDTIEAKNSMRNLAQLASVFFDELRSEGFGADAAMFLTNSWLVTTIECSG